MQGRWTSIGGVRAGRAEETRPHARAGHPPPPPLAPRSPVKTVLPRAPGTPSVCNARVPTKRGAVPDAAEDRWSAVPGRTGGTAGQGQPPPAAPPRDRPWGWPWGGRGVLAPPRCRGHRRPPTGTLWAGRRQQRSSSGTPAMGCPPPPLLFPATATGVRALPLGPPLEGLG